MVSLPQGRRPPPPGVSDPQGRPILPQGEATGACRDPPPGLAKRPIPQEAWKYAEGLGTFAPVVRVFFRPRLPRR
jgi:hypothetical protein